MTHRTLRVSCVALLLVIAGLALPARTANCALASPQNSADEAALRSLIERYFAAYAKEDLEAITLLWNQKSPDLPRVKGQLQEFFSSNDQIETRNLQFRLLKITGDRAAALATVDVSALNRKTGKPAAAVKLNRSMTFARETEGWRIWRDLSAEEELAERLVAAKSEEERQALLASEKELANVELRRALITKGVALRTKGNYPAALAVFELARKHAEQIADNEGAGEAWNQQGYMHLLQSNFDLALDCYRKGLALCEASGRKICTARLLLAIGDAHIYKGEIDLALEAFQKTLTLCEGEAGGKACAGNALGGIGSAHLEKGENDLAIEYYRKSLAIAEEVANKRNIATAFERLGLAYSRQDNNPRALENYQKSLSQWEAIGDKGQIARLQGNIGHIYGSQGAVELALGYIQKSLAVNESLGNKLGVAVGLNDIGRVHLNRGDYASAMKFFQQGLLANEAIGFKNGIVESLSGIGIIHNRQGNYSLALDYYGKSLALAETQQQRATVAVVLDNTGFTYSLQGDYARALEHYQKSLKIAESLGDKTRIAFILDNIGVNYRLQGAYVQALENFRKSLQLREDLGDKRAIAETLIDMSKAYFLQGDYARTAEHTERAIGLAREIGDREKLWDALTEAGRARRALGQPLQARQDFEEAVSVIEALRGQVAGGEQTQQQAFARKVSPYYEMIALLIAQGDANEALDYAEYAKGRVVLDVLSSGRVDITKAMTAQEQEQERTLRETVVSLNTQISAEARRPKPGGERLAQLRGALEKARLEQEDFQSRLYAAHPELRIQRGEAARFGLQDAASLGADASTALLEYAVTDDKTYLFVLTRATNNAAAEVKVYTIPVKRTELETKVESFREKVAAHNLLVREPARQVYDLLLKPALALLRNKTNLIIVPDDVLWDLPFQALQTESNHYLIEQSAISYAPSLTVLREMIAKRKERPATGAGSNSLLALGNPALGQETIERARSTRRDEKLEPLPEAEREVQTLARLYGPSKSEVFIGAEAREDRAKTEAGKFRVLHFATHGVVNNASPMYSHLVLSQGDGKEDGLLEAWELLNLDLKADLVVLSACETARGRVGAGEGMIGLSWALFVAGTPTAVVSQWKVDSASTTDLMLEFHRNRLAANSKAQSLRKAMLKMLGNNQYKHPFYWAPFVVIGDAN